MIDTPPEVLPGPLVAWNDYANFCLWKLVIKPDGEVAKVPVAARTGLPCDPHDPANQLTYDDARAAAVALGVGVGFVFRADTPWFFVDIDHCLEGGEWNETARQTLAAFPGAVVEISQSGTGLHVFGYSTSTRPHSNKNKALGVEFYTDKRFVALTMREVTGKLLLDFTRHAEAYTEVNFPPRESAGIDWDLGPDPEWRGPSDDAELLRRMLFSSDRSENSLLGPAQARGACFRWVYEANEEALAKFFPDPSRSFDWSGADASLCSRLAHWTGKDPERIERIWAASALGQRDKFTSRPDYRRDTIEFAISNCTSVYQDPRVASPVDLQLSDGTTPENVSAAGTYQFLAPDQQRGHFAGCVYIASRHEVFMPNGTMLSPPRFNARMGGYVFALDGTSSLTTKRAFEAFTESQVIRWPQADGTCFRPEDPPGAIVRIEGLDYCNTYVPPQVISREGDVTPFLNHLAKLLPDYRDRGIVLAKMAYCVQHPGHKSQWAIVMQGCPGNGKSFLGNVLTYAVGERYVHMPNADQLGSRFNAWAEGNRLCIVEEICVAGRPQIAETMKRLITGSRIEIESKGVNQRTGDNRANFLFFSNYKDGVIKIRDDRRYCVFFTPQQSLADIIRDGMGGAYFPDLYNWLNYKGGHAHTTYFLEHYVIPDELNPAVLAHRAPETTSTGAAIVASRGSFEQEVAEAIEEGRYGFRGGYISSCMVGDLVDERLRNERVPRNRRRALLESLDYVQHPGLPGGRANTEIAKEDKRRPTIYIRHDNPELVLTGIDAVQAYIRSQES